jgi:sugar fermentation stimulation protein A
LPQFREHEDLFRAWDARIPFSSVQPKAAPKVHLGNDRNAHISCGGEYFGTQQTGSGIAAGKVKSLAGYETLRTEVKYGRNSRIDILLEDRRKGRCYVEVKNCTLIEDGVAYFPDAVTERGLKHLKELQAMIPEGHRAVMFFLIQRMDARLFRPADHIDPNYGSELRRAVKNNVEIMAYDVCLDLERIILNQPMRHEL